MEHTDRTPLDISGSIPFLSVSKAVSCSAIFGTTTCPVQQPLERLFFPSSNKLGKKGGLDQNLHCEGFDHSHTSACCGLGFRKLSSLVRSSKVNP